MRQEENLTGNRWDDAQCVRFRGGGSDVINAIQVTWVPRSRFRKERWNLENVVHVVQFCLKMLVRISDPKTETDQMFVSMHVQLGNVLTFGTPDVPVWNRLKYLRQKVHPRINVATTATALPDTNSAVNSSATTKNSKWLKLRTVHCCNVHCPGRRQKTYFLAAWSSVLEKSQMFAVQLLQCSHVWC